MTQNSDVLIALGRLEVKVDALGQVNTDLQLLTNRVTAIETKVNGKASGLSIVGTFAQIGSVVAVALLLLDRLYA